MHTEPSLSFQIAAVGTRKTAFILKQGADGMPAADICRKAGISQATDRVIATRYGQPTRAFSACYSSLQVNKSNFVFATNLKKAMCYEA